MSGRRHLALRCPTCNDVVKSRDPEFPFCSGRCRLIDLGKWASGHYRISTPVPPGEIPFDDQPIYGGGSSVSDEEA